jgi:hypothetical protein
MQVLGKVIGRGGSATVHIGRWKETDVAVKMLRSVYSPIPEKEADETSLVKRRSSAPADLTQIWRSVSKEVRYLVSSLDSPGLPGETSRK